MTEQKKGNVNKHKVSSTVHDAGSSIAKVGAALGTGLAVVSSASRHARKAIGKTPTRHNRYLHALVAAGALVGGTAVISHYINTKS